MAEGQSKKIIIPKGTLQPGEDNVIEIPEECEDSRVLIAKLQAKYGRPPGYYPPQTNPDNKFERRIGDRVVGLGMPPLSPLGEEPRGYKSSFSRYGPPRPPPKIEIESYEPSYFGHDTTHGDQTVSGKLEYCPSSTPVAGRGLRPTEYPEFPSPRLSPIRMGRDIFAPEPSAFRSGYTPPGSPAPLQRTPSPRRPCPSLSSAQASPRGRSPQRSSHRRSRAGDRSISSGNVSDLISGDESRGPVPGPARTPSPRRPPARRPPARQISDRSCSIGDLSDMLSFDQSRGYRPDLERTPDSIRGLSQVHHNLLTTQSTAVPEELDHSALAFSMCELDSLELSELRTIQDRMRSFQEARRELVISILTLPEAEISL